MTTYIRYQCSICNREIESELDPLRPTLDKCNITYRCEGKLKKIGEKKLRSELVPLPQAGIDSWRQRGVSKPVAAGAGDAVWVNALGSDNTLTLATPANVSANLIVKFNLLSNSSRPYTDYTYSAPALTKIITGLDANSKNLRFAATDEVLVYLNGVKQTDVGPGATYSLDPLTFSVKFNSPFYDSSTVKVVVYGELTHTTYSLTASKGLNVTSAWGNVKKIFINGDEHDIYHLQIDDLPSNFYFNVSSVTAGGVVLSGVKMLLSYRPFTTLDREYGRLVPLTDSVKLNKTYSEFLTGMTVDSTFTVDCYPPATVVNSVENMYALDVTPLIAPGYSLVQNITASNVVIGPSV